MIDADVLTPVERIGDLWVKRDDLYEVDGSRGGKVRTCQAIADGAAGLSTACSRGSPQANIVATVAASLGIPARVYVPAAKGTTGEIEAARGRGAEIVEIRPGYRVVLEARARDDAATRGWTYVPFGMEHPAAVEQTAGQVSAEILGLVRDGAVRRIVVPVGSGMSLAGILTGLLNGYRAEDAPVVGVIVGADPVPRLDRYAPPFWLAWTTLVTSPLSYGTPYDGPCEIGGIPLDPYYEAKCLPFLRSDDLLWIVGRRET